MAAIGSIRKHGILLMVIIGIALLAFVLGDLTQLSAVFSDKYTMVKINSKKLDEDYRIRLDQNTSLWKIFYEKQQLDETEIYQVHDMTWNQLLEQTLMEEQMDGLGLSFTKEMIDEISVDMVASLQTQEPNQLLYRLVNFIAQQTSMEQAIGFISNVEDYKNDPQLRELYNAYKAIERFALLDEQRARYMAMAQNTVNFSDEAAKFFAENNNSLLTQVATFFPTAVQFNDIQPVVSDKEIRDWFNKHSNRFEVRENARDIDVAMFPIQPSPEDLIAIQDTTMNRFARLKETVSVEDFHISMMQGQLDSVYWKRADINIDTLAQMIFDRPIGSFIEPFEYEGMVWYYGKTYGSARRSDSVLIASLIVDFTHERNPGSTRTRAEAQTLADSLKDVLLHGANIFALMPDYRGGRDAADTTFWLSEHAVYPQLYNSFLENNVYVQDQTTAFVVHQVLQRTTPIEKRQFVIYTEENKPSDATVKSIRSQAMQLQAESNSAEELMTIAASKGIQVVQGQSVTSMMSSISQLQNAREIISWAFGPETKIDAVSDVYNINNNVFAVAAIRDIRTKGTPKLEVVRSQVEAELMATKKMEMIQDKINEDIKTGSSIQQVAEKYQVSLMDSVTLNFGSESPQNRNIEGTAIGKIFALPAQQPTAVIGKANVYAVSIYNINEASAPSATLTMERSMLKNVVAGRGRAENLILDGLKDRATITDQRYLFFAR